MQCEPDSNLLLHDLLSQLARFLNANESSISAAQITRCFQHLSTMEIAALHRVFFLLHQTKKTITRRPGTSQLSTKSQEHQRSTAGSCFSYFLGDPKELLLAGAKPPAGCQHHQPSRGHQYHQWPHRDPSQRHWPSSPSISTNGVHFDAPTPHLGTCVDPVSSVSRLTTPGSSRWSTSNVDLLTSQQHDTAADQTQPDNGGSSNSPLSTCSEIKLTPSTEKLLEKCKTNPAEFMRAITEAKIAFPAGQGWQAAMAAKKENTDMRELARIYQRFECYNIFTHVVEAQYHTGTHWIRDKRSELIKGLCHDFPERFQNQKAAGKCLHWVDQGCKYHEWAKIFTGVEELGYLLALPVDIPHSAYTTRCTREQMIALSVHFKELGICELVVNLQLSRLGEQIVSALRDMTADSGRHVNVVTSTVPRTSQYTTQPESTVPSVDETIMLLEPNSTTSSTESDFFYQAPLGDAAYSERNMSQMAAHSLAFDNWY